MDLRNETSIWGMLLNVCSEHKAQYFYMAPKFPYSLPFNRQVMLSWEKYMIIYYYCVKVTMLICNNGLVSKTDDSQFNTQKFVKRALKRR